MVTGFSEARGDFCPVSTRLYTCVLGGKRGAGTRSVTSVAKSCATRAPRMDQLQELGPLGPSGRCPS